MWSLDVVIDEPLLRLVVLVGNTKHFLYRLIEL